MKLAVLFVVAMALLGTTVAHADGRGVCVVRCAIKREHCRRDEKGPRCRVVARRCKTECMKRRA